MNLVKILLMSMLLMVSSAEAASKQEIDTDVEYALKAFYNLAPGNKELASKASGILVFPTVMKAGFSVGGGAWPFLVGGVIS